MTALPITVDGDLCTVTFQRFDLEHYELFLRAKQLPESQIAFDWQRDTYTLTTPARFAARLGVDIAPIDHGRMPLADQLFDYQQWAVGMALDAKRFALWLDTGLGKTICYLEWARQVRAITRGRVLILAPPQIIPQVIEMAGELYGPTYQLVALRTRDDLDVWLRGAGTVDVALVNYEKFIPGTMSSLRNLAGLVADESGILKTGGGKIKWNLIKSARGIEYKLSCTATPAPNEAMEYASQAAFLEKLRSEGDILWTYFVRDKRGEWSVKPHARGAFYSFMASWSLYLRDPATFGFADILRNLPEPEIVEERIEITDAQRALLDELLTRHNLGLWADDRVSVTVRQKLLQVARGFRYVGTGKDRTVERVPAVKPGWVADRAVAEVAAGRRVLIWTTFDEEGEVLAEALAGRVPAAILHGKQDIDERVRILKDFREGVFDVLISKPQLVGYGLNLQFVTSMIFSGFDDCYDEETEILTKHRGWLRFGELRRSDSVATVNPKTLAFEWQRPERIIWKRYAGPMVRFYGPQSHDLLVTPNHKMFVKRCEVRYGGDSGRWHQRYAVDLAVNFHRQEYRMRSAALMFGGVRPNWVDIPPIERSRKAPEGTLIVERIAVDDFVLLAGWYLSEGYCRPVDSREFGRIVISQTDRYPEHRAEIIALLERIGLTPNTRTKDITVYSRELAAFLIDQFGDSSHTKHIPRWVKEFDGKLLEVLRDTMLKGDGCTSRGRITSYRSSSRQLLDDFQELCIKTGVRGSVKDMSEMPSVKGRGRGEFFGAVTTAFTEVEPSVHRQPEIIDYTGMIGCVTVPNHVVIVRRNGVPVVSGNSFERMYQAVRRAYRYGQTERVRVFVPYVPELEGLVFENVRAKEARFLEDVAAQERAYRAALGMGSSC